MQLASQLKASKKYRESFKGKSAKIRSEKSEKGRIRSRKYILKSKYKITYEEYLEMIKNQEGFDMRFLIKDSISIPWSPYNIKENLWKPVQLAFVGKKSTRLLNTEEINKIYDVINKEVGERTGIHIPFPCLT